MATRPKVPKIRPRKKSARKTTRRAPRMPPRRNPRALPAATVRPAAGETTPPPALDIFATLQAPENIEEKS